MVVLEPQREQWPVTGKGLSTGPMAITSTGPRRSATSVKAMSPGPGSMRSSFPRLGSATSVGRSVSRWRHAGSFGPATSLRNPARDQGLVGTSLGGGHYRSVMTVVHPARIEHRCAKSNLNSRNIIWPGGAGMPAAGVNVPPWRAADPGHRPGRGARGAGARPGGSPRSRPC